MTLSKTFFDNKTKFLVSHAALVVAGMFLILGLTGCDDSKCVPCEGPFGCLKLFDDDCPAGYIRKGHSTNTNIAECPATDFMVMENREICNEDFCVAIVDDYVECEKIDCFSIECYGGE